MLLSLQMRFSFVRAAVACAILERTSGLESSSETTAPRYLKLVTVPSLCPFISISLLLRLALFFISLVFSALLQVLSRLSTRASSSCSSSDMTRSKTMLKRVGDRRHPCLTPTVVLNRSSMLLFIWTALVAFSYSCSMVRTRFALILYYCTDIAWWSKRLHLLYQSIF